MDPGAHLVASIRRRLCYVPSKDLRHGVRARRPRRACRLGPWRRLDCAFQSPERRHGGAGERGLSALGRPCAIEPLAVATFSDRGCGLSGVERLGVTAPLAVATLSDQGYGLSMVDRGLRDRATHACNSLRETLRLSALAPRPGDCMRRDPSTRSQVAKPRPPWGAATHFGSDAPLGNVLGDAARASTEAGAAAGILARSSSRAAPRKTRRSSADHTRRRRVRRGRAGSRDAENRADRQAVRGSMPSMSGPRHSASTIVRLRSPSRPGRHRAEAGRRVRNGRTLRRRVVAFTKCKCAGAKLPGVPRPERPRRSR